MISLESEIDLPHYYSEKYFGSIPALQPFVVCPLEETQDTIVFGPAHIGKNHDEFVNHVYGPFEGTTIECLGARLFQFRNKYVLCVIVPSNLSDQGGRTGLKISYGFIVDARIDGRKCKKTLTAYLALMAKILGRTSGNLLVEEGSDTLIEFIRSSFNDDTKRRAIGDWVDSMRLAAYSISEFSPLSTSASAFMRKISKKQEPNEEMVLLYNQSSAIVSSAKNFPRIIHIFLTEALGYISSAAIHKQDPTRNIFSLLPVNGLPTKIKMVSVVNGDYYQILKIINSSSLSKKKKYLSKRKKY